MGINLKKTLKEEIFIYRSKASIDQEMGEQPIPGCAKARKLGCTCMPQQKSNEIRFWIDPNCPMHFKKGATDE